jgi:3-hydroxybutyrate dehydrogenase
LTSAGINKAMKTVLITGSTAGIGLGIALEFAKTTAYNIVFSGLEENGEEIANSIGEKFGISVMFSDANMLMPAELRKMVDDAVAKFGQIDVLVNNAGVQYVSPIEAFPDEKWAAILGVNLSAAFYLTKAVWSGMKERKFGRIINIASAHGLVASEFKTAYVASKHGLVGFTKSIALEGAPYNITANAICPGYVKTQLVDKQISDQANARHMSAADVINNVLLSKHAVKEFVPAELIGQMAVFIASDNAATLTGTALPIDGGWTAK